MEHREQSHEQNPLMKQDTNERQQFRPDESTDAPPTTRIEGSPIRQEDLERRFADPSEAAADTQLSAHSGEKPLPFEELQRRYGHDADAAADRMLSSQLIDDPRLDTVVRKLEAIDILKPDRWSSAESHDRQLALREANRILADSLGQPSSEVTFDKINSPLETHIQRDGNWPGFHRSGDPYFIQLSEDFLESDKSTDPREALNALCHEYRHVYQGDILANDGRGASESIAEVSSWLGNSKDGAYIQPEENFDAYKRQPLESDSRTFADEICRRLYGS
jgi:hypothetical protein